MIHIRRKKTGEDVWIPILADLWPHIRDPDRGDPAFLMTRQRNRRPFTDAGIGMRIREWCDAAGLPHCTAHGLGKAGTRKFAAAGFTDRQIMAITGHKTESEVTRYTETADRKRLAARGMARMGTVIDPSSGRTATDPAPVEPAGERTPGPAAAFEAKDGGGRHRVHEDDVARERGGQRQLFPGEFLAFLDTVSEAGGTRHTGAADRETDAVRAAGRIGEADDPPDAGPEVPGFDSPSEGSIPAPESNPKGAVRGAKNGVPWGVECRGDGQEVPENGTGSPEIGIEPPTHDHRARPFRAAEAMGLECRERAEACPDPATAEPVRQAGEDRLRLPFMDMTDACRGAWK